TANYSTAPVNSFPQTCFRRCRSSVRMQSGSLSEQSERVSSSLCRAITSLRESDAPLQANFAPEQTSSPPLLNHRVESAKFHPGISCRESPPDLNLLLVPSLFPRRDLVS